MSVLSQRHFFFFFGMPFSGVILNLVPPIKPVSPVAEDKENVSLQFFCTSISSGASGSD